MILYFVSHRSGGAESTSTEKVEVNSVSIDEVQRLWNAEDYANVVKATDPRINANPADFFSLLYRGFAGFYLGYSLGGFDESDPVYAQAIADLRRALVLEPFRANGDIHYMLGKLYYLRGYYYQDLAREELQLAESEGYIREDLYEYLGRVCADLGDEKQAIAYLEKAYGLAPNDEVLLALTRAYIGSSDYQKGLSNIQSIEARTKDPVVLQKAQLMQGDLLLKQNKVDEAVAVYESVVKASPNSADAHFFLGEAYHAKGDVVRARSEWRVALTINPKHHGAASRLSS